MTFKDMQMLFIKVIDENVSSQDFEAAILPYGELPLPSKDFHANAIIAIATSTNHPN
jgi:hypothetical protein